LPFWGIEGFLISRVFEVFSAVELGVNGPHSGSDHRYCEAQATQHDGDQPIPRPRQPYPDLDNGNRNSGQWRPKAKKQKYPRDSREQIREV